MHLVTPQTNTKPSSHQIIMQYLLAVLLTLPILNNYTIGTVDGKQVNIQTNPYGYTVAIPSGRGIRSGQKEETTIQIKQWSQSPLVGAFVPANL